MSPTALPSTYAPVFDRFSEKMRKAQKETFLQSSQMTKEIQLASLLATTHFSTVEHCKKVILTESALVMLDALMAAPTDYDIPQEGLAFQPDFSPLWFEIDAQASPPFYDVLGIKIRGALLDNLFCQESREAVQKKLSPAEHPFIESIFGYLRRWRYFYLISEDGTAFFSFAYDLQQQQWIIREEWECPYGLCQQKQGEKKVQPCQRCQEALSLFSVWLLLLWVSLQGVFRKPDGEVFVQRVRRCERKKDNPKKKQVINIERRFHIVRTIDISVKAPKPTHEEDEQELQATPRGSWVKKAEERNPDLVSYEVREIPERERTLSHPRYANYIKKHGTNKVKIKAHSRSFPMLNDPLRVTRVRARRYEKTSPTDK